MKLFSKFTYLRKVMHHTKSRIVGGAVRNYLWKIPAVDEIDLATPLRPETVMRIGEKLGFRVVPIKIDHGTVLLVKGGENYEITTLRDDVVCNGRWAEVRYTHSWVRDAYRRDFTFNTLYMDKNSKIYDYTNGMRDVESRTLRFVGDARTRIAEDYLRIIRLFRFWAHYADSCVCDMNILIELKHGLEWVSKERIVVEMLKLYKAQDPWDVIRSMKSCGIVVTCESRIIDWLQETELKRRLSPFTRLAMTCDIKGWPISCAQNQWQKCITVEPKSDAEVVRSMHKNGLDFALDYAALYAPHLLPEIRKISIVAECPIRASELPLEPGREMGVRYKKLREWWTGRLPFADKNACFEWYRAHYCI